MIGSGNSILKEFIKHICNEIINFMSFTPVISNTILDIKKCMSLDYVYFHTSFMSMGLNRMQKW